MRKISVKESATLSSPHLFALILSKDMERKVNIMGLSWFTFVSFNPAKILTSISQKGYTNKNLKKTKYFTLCLPLEEIKEKSFWCCKNSGINTDKIAKTGLELLEIEGFKVPVLKQCSVAWALEVEKIIEESDHSLFISIIKESVQISNKNNLYAFDGFTRLDTIQ